MARFGGIWTLLREFLALLAIEDLIG